MKTLKLLNFERDRWVAGDTLVDIPSAIDGTPVAATGSAGNVFGGFFCFVLVVGCFVFCLFFFFVCVCVRKKNNN